jgi:hypothetical protein
MRLRLINRCSKQEYRRSRSSKADARAAMPYLVKKVGGLALILLGGLTIAHGVVAQQTWEIVPGLILAIIGAALLAGKILRRNTFPTGGEQ